MRKLFTWLLALFLVTGVITAMPISFIAAQAVPSTDGAFEDLGRCLQSQGKNKY